MTAPTACYFCDTTDEVETGSIPGAGQVTDKTVSLCPRCRDNLSAVIAPIVDRLSPAASGVEDDPAKSLPEDGGGSSAGATVPGANGAEDIPIDVSTKTVNRVVRLLQNREFPIDMPSFVDIATSAYELDSIEVEAVLDMAIDRGLLVRSGDTLHRPTTTSDMDT